MAEWLIHKLIPNWRDTQTPSVRMRYGILASWIGIICNLLLTAAKAAIGILAGSISIIADAGNNLSDASSNLVTLLGFKMAEKPADHEHPFGHGRYEYLSGLVVSVIIVAVGIQLTQTSIQRIFHPKATSFSAALVCVMLVSVAIKAWMSSFNFKAGQAISSQALLASAKDSKNDCITTTAILICATIGAYTNVNIDGFAGCVVGIFIIKSGIELVGSTLNPLLGQTPDPELVKHIKDTILSYPGVLGTHDLMVHDYGPGRLFASAHVEMAAETDPIESHDTLDNIEYYFKKHEGLQIVLHYDPIITEDPYVLDLRHWLSENITTIHPDLSIHDLRVVPGPTHTNVIFDCVVPPQLIADEDKLRVEIENLVKTKVADAFCKITFDASYVVVD